MPGEHNSGPVFEKGYPDYDAVNDIDYNEHEPVIINDIKLKEPKKKTMPDIEKIREQGF